MNGEQNFQFDGNTLKLTGDSIINGTEFVRSDIGSSVGVGTTTISTIPVSSGNSAIFDYYVSDGTNMRAGTIISVWDSSSSTYTDYSTPDLNGSTAGISLITTISGTDLLLRASVSSGSWTVKVANKIIF